MSTKGLTSSQAKELLTKNGPNEITTKAEYTALKILSSQVKNLFFFLLLFASLLSFVLGDQLDGTLILFILSLNTALGFWQEYKASRELQALKKLEVQYSRVIRDGVQIQLPSKELVVGDLVVLEAGDKIPADCKVIESHDLLINESALTGESVPVIKSTRSQNNQIYLGTAVVSGRAQVLVVHTGKDTRFGSIATTLSSLQKEQTPLEKSLNVLGQRVSMLAIFAALIMFLVRNYQGFESGESFFTSIALMVAAVPEGLPAVITIALALGVRRMYHKKTIVRRMSSIESLGSATVILSDKTGTLTKNEMRVKEMVLQKGAEIDIKKASIVCNSASLILKDPSTLLRAGSFDVLGDSTEGALLIWAHQKGLNIEEERSVGKLLQEDPFSLKTRMMSVLWQEGKKVTQYSKGAPEVILSISSLSPVEVKKYTKQYEILASKGLRVLAFAKKDFRSKEAKIAKKGLTFLGFVGIADEARQEAKEAVVRAQNAGIKVVMVTGDNELTARAIGHEVGIFKDGDEVLTGTQLEMMDDAALLERLDKIKIFARVVPEHKLRIVKAFQQIGEVVAVTGDGVNDSLALKQAEVGIAMGKTGTDVAKEASDIVILDDNFVTIVSAIEEGRLIYDNIVKVVKFLLAGNLAESLVILSAVLFNIPNPLLPVQILWINFVTDGLPALMMVSDPPSRNVMSKLPEKHSATLFSLAAFRFIASAAVVMSIITMLLFVLVLNTSGIQTARDWAFSAIVVVQMVFVFIVRGNFSLTNNLGLTFSVLFILLMQMIIILYPPLQMLFKI